MTMKMMPLISVHAGPSCDTGGEGQQDARHHVPPISGWALLGDAEKGDHGQQQNQVVVPAVIDPEARNDGCDPH